MLDPVAELPEDLLRHVVGTCVPKKTPTPLERIRRTVWATDSRNASVAPLKSRCASSKKKTSFGCSRSPASGSCSKSSGEEPHERRRAQSRPVLDGRQLEAGRRCRGRRGLSGGGRARPAEAPRRTPCRRRPRARRGYAAGRRPSRRQTADALELRMPASESRKVSSARRSARSSRGRPASSAKRKTSARLCSWVSFASRGSSRAAADRSRRRWHEPARRADAAEREELDREAGRLEGEAQLGHALAAGPPAPLIRPIPETSPFTSAAKTATRRGRAARREPEA